MKPAAMETDAPLKVLLIDDNTLNLDYLESILQTAGYQTLKATDGETGLQKAQKLKPGLILLDIVMPGMDGFEVCRKLKKMQDCQRIPVIFLSGKGGTKTIVQAFQSGGIDYVKKPFVKEEVLARVEAHIKIGLLNEELRCKNLALKEKQKHLDTDLKAAGEIQRSLLPREGSKFHHVEFQWLFRPSENIGGDIFNIIPIEKDYIAFYILDVSGHGVPSALVATSVAQVLLPHSGIIKQENASYGNNGLMPPCEVLGFLDQYFPLERFDKYFTILFGYLNLHTGELRYSHAAHPFGYLIQNGSIIPMKQGGSIIGIHAGIPFREGVTTLQPGDTLFLYTDGITELTNTAGEMFGENKLTETLQQHKGERVEAIVEAMQQKVDHFGSPDNQKDDISLMCIRYTPGR